MYYSCHILHTHIYIYTYYLKLTIIKNIKYKHIDIKKIINYIVVCINIHLFIIFLYKLCNTFTYKFCYIYTMYN